MASDSPSVVLRRPSQSVYLFVLLLSLLVGVGVGGGGAAGMRVVALSFCRARLRLAPLTLSCLSSDMHHRLSLWADASGRRFTLLPVSCDSVCGSTPVFVLFSFLVGVVVSGKTGGSQVCHRKTRILLP